MLDATVSLGATIADMTQFNLKSESVIHTVTNYELSKEQDIRYEYDSILY